MDDYTIKMISTLMSAITIGSCLFLKVPQIMTVMERKSADGLHLQALSMEITGFTITSLYCFISEYSILTYMEYPIILIQVYVLLYYVLLYRGMLHWPLIRMTIWTYVGLVVGFLSGILPKFALSCLVPLCTPLSGFAKVSYVYGMVSTSNADNISLTTWIISVLTNLSRIFTVYVDSGDNKLMFNFFVSSILSASVLFTAIYYKSFVTAPLTSPRTRRKPSCHQRSGSLHND